MGYFKEGGYEVRDLSVGVGTCLECADYKVLVPVLGVYINGVLVWRGVRVWCFMGIERAMSV